MINGRNLLYPTNGLFQVWKNILNTHPREKTVRFLRKYGDNVVDSYDYGNSYAIIPAWVRAGERNLMLFRAGGLEVPIIVNNQLYKKYNLSGAITHKALFFLCISSLIIFSPVPPAFSAQTRDQCEKCCRSSNQDEYYSEQCRLKCFRNPDHCVDQKSKPDDQEELTSPSPTPRARVRPLTVAPGTTPPRVSGPPPSAPGTMGPPPSVSGDDGTTVGRAHHSGTTCYSPETTGRNRRERLPLEG